MGSTSELSLVAMYWRGLKAITETSVSAARW
jgi:hypothetical protein